MFSNFVAFSQYLKFQTLSTKFAVLDEDESGKVSILELKNALLKKDIPYEDRMFDILDRDKNGLVTLDEYIKTYIEIHAYEAKRKGEQIKLNL